MGRSEMKRNEKKNHNKQRGKEKKKYGWYAEVSILNGKMTLVLSPFTSDNFCTYAETAVMQQQQWKICVWNCDRLVFDGDAIATVAVVQLKHMASNEV